MSEEEEILRAEAMIQQQPSLPLTHLLLLCLSERLWPPGGNGDALSLGIAPGVVWSLLPVTTLMVMTLLPGGVAAHGSGL